MLTKRRSTCENVGHELTKNGIAGGQLNFRSHVSSPYLATSDVAFHSPNRLASASNLGKRGCDDCDWRTLHLDVAIVSGEIKTLVEAATDLSVMKSPR